MSFALPLPLLCSSHKAAKKMSVESRTTTQQHLKKLIWMFKMFNLRGIRRSSRWWRKWWRTRSRIFKDDRHDWHMRPPCWTVDWEHESTRSSVPYFDLRLCVCVCTSPRPTQFPYRPPFSSFSSSHTPLASKKKENIEKKESLDRATPSAHRVLRGLVI